MKHTSQRTKTIAGTDNEIPLSRPTASFVRTIIHSVLFILIHPGTFPDFASKILLSPPRQKIVGPDLSRPRPIYWRVRHDRNHSIKIIRPDLSWPSNQPMTGTNLFEWSHNSVYGTGNPLRLPSGSHLSDQHNSVYGTGNPLRLPSGTGNPRSCPAALHHKKFDKILQILLIASLTLILTSCTFPGMVSTSQQLPPTRPTSQTSSLPPVHFPQDEGAHNDLTEWWYYTGHLTATDSHGKTHQYGFEFVIFQALRSNLPPVYTSHFAISDVTQSQFHYVQRSLIEPVPIPDGNSTKGIDVQAGNWSMQGLNGQDHLIASMQDYAIDLHLSALKPLVLHNGNGIITLGTAGFSYYYSRPRMSISGTINDHQQSLSVKGLAWMDHQWGNFLALGDGGWDWYSIQLSNNTEMMLYFIRDATGNISSTYGDYLSADGKTHQLAAQAIQSTVLAHWTSPLTGATYPSGWRFTIHDPQWQGTLTLTPQLKNQELNVCPSSGTVYWEGAVTIQAQAGSQSLNGEGYVELTGYPTNACSKSTAN